jgi:hypothetical protein
MFFALAIVLFAATIAQAATVAQPAKVNNPLDAKTMKVALHVSEQEDDGFIELVLARVDAGTLPLDMVQSTFLWAKKKPRHKFQYFKFGLKQRAEDAGIKL